MTKDKQSGNAIADMITSLFPRYLML